MSGNHLFICNESRFARNGTHARWNKKTKPGGLYVVVCPFFVSDVVAAKVSTRPFRGDRNRFASNHDEHGMCKTANIKSVDEIVEQCIPCRCKIADRVLTVVLSFSRVFPYPLVAGTLPARKALVTNKIDFQAGHGFA
jgi:hypothetical protein